jgi:hypothetical protein
MHDDSAVSLACLPACFFVKKGFRKQDCRVDGAGRLTVRGQRSDAAANPRHSRFSKVFQLPSTSNNDGINGRFDAGVLTVTVPKQQAKAPPAGDTKRKAKEDGEANKPKDDAKPEDAAAAASKKPAADAGQMADAKSGKPEPAEQPKAAAPPPPAVRKQKGKAKAGAAAAAPAPAAADTKQATPKPAPPPPQAD